MLFHAVNLREQDAAANATNIRQEGPAMLAALELSIGQRPDDLAAKLVAYRQLLLPRISPRLRRGCFQVLVMWAEAEFMPLSGKAAPSQAQVRQALNLLDVAAAIAKACRFPVPDTLHKRRSDCLDRLGDRRRPARNGNKRPRTSPHGPGLFSGPDDYRRRDYLGTGVACEEVLQQEPENFRSQYLQSLGFANRGNWAEAKIVLTNCLSRRPDFYWARLLRGAVHGQLAAYDPLIELDAAEHDFAQVLEQSSEPFVARSVHTTRGAMWVRVHRWSDAVADLRQAIQEQPDVPEGYSNLARLTRDSRMGQGVGRAEPGDPATPHRPGPLPYSRPIAPDTQGPSGGHRGLQAGDRPRAEGKHGGTAGQRLR